MTDSNIRLNVADEMRLSETALRAADALLGLGIAPDAASRIYYAVFHAGRALLYSLGMEVRSHAGLRSQLSRQFVQTGLLPAERAKDLAQLEALREAGDYDSAFALGVDDLRPEWDRACRFVADARALLHSQAWID